VQPPERTPLAAQASEALVALGRRLESNISAAVQIRAETLEHLLVALLAEGHVLVEDYPGVGKTALARALARSIDCQFARVQCTSDLLPADIVGTNVYDQREGRFEFRPGPVFANIVLVDEINRASPKTQSGLLECMQERRVTVDIHSHELARPFLVLATQNPIEYEGTYPLPEAQLDRFLAKIDGRHQVPANATFLVAAVSLVVGNTSIVRPALAVKDIVFGGRPTLDDAALMLLQFARVDLGTATPDPSELARPWRFHSSDAHTASTSRQAISAYLRAMAANEDQIFAAAVINVAMIAHTVEHAPGLVEVRIDWTGEKPVVAVRDKGPGLRAEPNALPNLMAESGRGLFLIRAFAESTYVQTAKGRGTEISVVLPTARKLSEP